MWIVGQWGGGGRAWFLIRHKSARTFPHFHGNTRGGLQNTFSRFSIATGSQIIILVSLLFIGVLSHCLATLTVLYLCIMINLPCIQFSPQNCCARLVPHSLTVYCPFVSIFVEYAVHKCGFSTLAISFFSLYWICLLLIQKSSSGSSIVSGSTMAQLPYETGAQLAP